MSSTGLVLTKITPSDDLNENKSRFNVKRIAMAEELSGITVVVIIGMGVLTFLLLFIFGKRQIMRFQLRARRGPHVPIGHDAKKALKREIERRIDLIPRIVCEPRLIARADPKYILYPGQQVPSHYYRFKAVDDVKILEREITRQDSCLTRHPSENLRAYLLTTLAVPLNGAGQQRLIHQFCDLYEHARHDPNHFGDDDYQAYNRLLLKLVDAAKMLKSFNTSRKSSPNRTPQRQKGHHHHGYYEKGTNNKNLLDPARLRPAGDEISGVGERIESGRPTTLTVSVQPTPLLADNETSV